MANKFSFDIVSEYDKMELKNALDQTQKEILQRYDFKGTDSSIDFDNDDNALIIIGDNNYKVDAIIDILETRMVKRGISLKVLDKSTPREYASGDKIRQKVTLRHGMDSDKVKEIAKIIRGSYPKVKTQIQGDSIRVVSPSKDELQELMKSLKNNDKIDIPIQFTNYK